MAASLWLFPADSDGAFAAYDGVGYAMAAETGASEPSNFYHPLFHTAAKAATSALRRFDVERPGHVAVRVVSGLGAVATFLLIALAAGAKRWVAGLGFAAALFATWMFLVDAAIGETVVPGFAAALWAVAEASRTPVRPARAWLALVLALLLRADAILVVPGVIAGLLAGKDRGQSVRRVAAWLAIAGAATVAAYLLFWWAQTDGGIPIWKWASSYPAMVSHWVSPKGLQLSAFSQHVDALSAAVVGKSWPPDRMNLWIGPSAVVALIAAGILLRGTARVGPLVAAALVTVVVRAVFFSWFDAANPEWSVFTLALAAFFGASLAAGEPRLARAPRIAGGLLLIGIIAGSLLGHGEFTWRLRSRAFIQAMRYAVDQGRGCRVIVLGPDVDNALNFLRVEHTVLAIPPGAPEAMPAIAAELAARPEPTLIVFERRAPWMVTNVPYLMTHAPPPGLSLDDLPPTPGALAIQWDGYTYAIRYSPPPAPK